MIQGIIKKIKNSDVLFIRRYFFISYISDMTDNEWRLARQRWGNEEIEEGRFGFCSGKRQVEIGIFL